MKNKSPDALQRWGFFYEKHNQQCDRLYLFHTNEKSASRNGKLTIGIWKLKVIVE